MGEDGGLQPAAMVQGLDGCREGWILARWVPGGALNLLRISDLAEAFPAGTPPLVSAIDIPIGLPDRVGAGGRGPDRAVRPLLGQRQSSVFSVPSRRAVETACDISIPEEARYRAACTAALETSDPPRKISRQSFALFPKVLDVDRLLRARPGLPLTECHPKVSFWAMNGQKPLDLPKKVKGTPAAPGLDLRIRLLAAEGVPVDQLTRERARALRAGLDDLVDACACAWTAARIARGAALVFPDPPERDRHGLPVAITA